MSQIIEKRDFDASPEALWVIVHNPSNMPAWNEKCVEADTLNGLSVGMQFLTVHQMNHKRIAAMGEVISYEEPRFLHFRYTYEHGARLGTIDELFEIKPLGKGRTRLIHTVDFAKSTLPRWAKWLIGFLRFFGKPKGPKQPLEGIDELLPSRIRDSSSL